MSILSGTLGAVMSADSAGEATQANKDISANTLSQQKEIYKEEVARQKPFYDQGVKASGQLDKMINGGYSMQESPAAQYQLQQGSRSLNRQLAARGLLGSGNASQRLAELSAGVASNDYNQQYSRLLDQIKEGTGASASMGGASQTLSQNVGQNAQNMMQANNQGASARASLYSGMGGASSGAANTAINAWRAYQGGGAGAGAEAGTTYDAGGAYFGGNAAGSGAVDNYGAELAL